MKQKHTYLVILNMSTCQLRQQLTTKPYPLVIHIQPLPNYTQWNNFPESSLLALITLLKHRWNISIINQPWPVCDLWYNTAGSLSFKGKCIQEERIAFNKQSLESVLRAKQMEFNCNLGGITSTWRGLERSWCSSYLEPSLLRESGTSRWRWKREAERKRDPRNFCQWNGKWSVTPALEIQIRRLARETNFYASVQHRLSATRRPVQRKHETFSANRSTVFPGTSSLPVVR